jgi:hypothetical protein
MQGERNVYEIDRSLARATITGCVRVLYFWKDVITHAFITNRKNNIWNHTQRVSDDCSKIITYILRSQLIIGLKIREGKIKQNLRLGVGLMH